MILPMLFLSKKINCDFNKEFAFHEAGHCFAALYYGHIPDYAVLMNEAGRVNGWHDYLFNPDPIEFGLSWIYAGIVSQARFTGIYDIKKSKGDFDQVETLIRLYDVSAKNQLKIWSDTHNLIEKHWQSVSEIAEDLFKHKVLTHDYFYKIALRE
jgi:hypothetical protein